MTGDTQRVLYSGGRTVTQPVHTCYKFCTHIHGWLRSRIQTQICVPKQCPFCERNVSHSVNQLSVRQWQWATLQPSEDNFPPQSYISVGIYKIFILILTMFWRLVPWGSGSYWQCFVKTRCHHLQSLSKWGEDTEMVVQTPGQKRGTEVRSWAIGPVHWELREHDMAVLRTSGTLG